MGVSADGTDPLAAVMQLGSTRRRKFQRPDDRKKRSPPAVVPNVVLPQTLMDAATKAYDLLDEILAADPLAGLTEAWSWGFICTPRMTALLFNDLNGSTESWPEGMRCN